MKKEKFLTFVLTAAISLSAVFGAVACDGQEGAYNGQTGGYTISVDTEKPFELKVGDTVDFKQYFTVTDPNGNGIVITDAMLDLSRVDTSKEGEFTVTLTIGGASKDIKFTVTANGGDNGDDVGNDNPVFSQYADISKWNFADSVTLKDGGSTDTEYYEYLGESVLYRYTYYGEKYTDYMGYNESDKYCYYYDNGKGGYDTYEENTSDFEELYSFMSTVDLSDLNAFSFTQTGNEYVADDPVKTGNAVLGQYDASWTSFKITVANGKIAKIEGELTDGYSCLHELSKYGEINFTLPEGGGGGVVVPPEPTGVMQKQDYNQATFDNERLQDKLTKTGKYADPAIGLPSTGTYNALVIPVQFKGDTITQTQLDNLNIAFNGTAEQTGWESVHSYYEKASYGKLNLSFDIAGVNMQDIGYYQAKYNSSYYENSQATDEESGEKYNNGDNLILHEALTYYESRLDLTKYDTNGDHTIDAVYLVYSAKVDYSDDSFYWAFVTWNYEEKTYDGTSAYYYLFAGLGFMDESVQGKNTNSNYPVISGLKVNASTYIHETGHLLGLDDYYDYYPGQGGDEGLGGADMMDATVGDQNVYSKTMLGWLTPTVVNSTATITLKSSQAAGDAILIPLDFNNSYFCEYLLIDLYSAQGLNAMHASQKDGYLYDGAAYGVRIYHVSSWIKNAYDNDFGSFTDNNNSLSDISLIKLVEADGDRKFASSGGYADRTDLWQAGDKLSEVFPKYATYGGKTLIFDISIVSVSATEATVTITYNA